MKEQLAVSKIKEGTVIDHITAGKALLVLKILKIHPGSRERVLMAMNVPSRKMGKKDIVKVEGKFIGEEELNKISLIAPKATINLIRNYDIYKKFKVSLPERIDGVLFCPNRNCITNSNEPITRKFHVKMVGSSVEVRCHYCGRKIKEVDKYVIS